MGIATNALLGHASCQGSQLKWSFLNACIHLETESLSK